MRAFLAASTVFGLSQALGALFLNFYLHALGLGVAWQGALNALPALTLVLTAIPLASLARRISNARVLQLGAVLMLLGTGALVLAHGAGLALVGSVLQGTGSACMAVCSSPYMASQTRPEQRVTLFSVQLALVTGAGFLGNLLGGELPTAYAALFGGSLQGAGAIRFAFVGALVAQVLGLIPLARLHSRRDGVSEPPRSGRTLAVDNRPQLVRLILPNACVGLGAGATIPFLNVFIEGKFGVSYASLGQLFAWTSLATAATVLIQPWLVRRLGHLRAVLAVQAASLPFLALMGYGPTLWLVTVALFTRGALMNAAGPAYNAHAMNTLSEQDRPVYSAFNPIIWSLCWALSSVGAGFVRSRLPLTTAFDLLFAWTILMYVLSVVAIYSRLLRPSLRASREVAGTPAD